MLAAYGGQLLVSSQCSIDTRFNYAHRGRFFPMQSPADPIGTLVPTPLLLQADSHRQGTRCRAITGSA